MSDFASDFLTSQCTSCHSYAIRHISNYNKAQVPCSGFSDHAGSSTAGRPQREKRSTDAGKERLSEIV
jgi:hypothetical protein